MVRRLLLRPRALHELERLLRRRALVDDRADRADHANRIRGLPDVAAHVDAPSAVLRRVEREFEGIEFRLELRTPRDDERDRTRLDDFRKVLAVVGLDEMRAELRGDAAGEAEVPRVPLLRLL